MPAKKTGFGSPPGLMRPGSGFGAETPRQCWTEVGADGGQEDRIRSVFAASRFGLRAEKAWFGSQPGLTRSGSQRRGSGSPETPEEEAGTGRLGSGSSGMLSQ